MAKNYQKTVDEIRQKIQDTRRERDQLATAPLPAEEIQARVDAWINRKAEQAQRRFGLVGQALARPGGRVETEVDPFHVYARGEAKAADVGPLLCAMFPERVRDAVMSGLNPDADALPMSERPARLADLDRQVLALETAEEDAIREAAAAGVTIERRPDVSPDAILRPEWPDVAEG
ncbi:conserved hypothetical protein [Thioalkalivibrio sp. K90mix]|uniref:hypothetical protein n=1 Tax=Thioalkalivibrio sp. (strain K90mix) TaxID=396595 RepID=UPI000195A3D9|nr:hypothetical protein [Thioalkalivibrio sp. K90mix]ADC71745.1 conserved hypothetical protein [Thioalkalivibrio sp. K90mix]